MNETSQADKELSLDLLRRLNSACDRFEAELSRGGPPRIEIFLSEWQGTERRELLRELMALELTYRIQAGARPDAQQYSERFPDDADLVGEVFRELRLAGETAETTLWFGISALRLDVIGREQLIAGMRQWALDKNRPLGQILIQQGALSAQKSEWVAAIAGNHLLKHGKGEEAILSVIAGHVSVLDELRTLADPELQSLLDRLAAAVRLEKSAGSAEAPGGSDSGE